MPADRVEIVGLRELQKTLKRLSDSGEWTKELRDTNKRSAEIVADRAKALAPVRTGKLRSSIRARGSQREGSIAGGGARVPYFGFIDFGGTIRFRQSSRVISRPYLRGGRILYRALDERRDRVVDAYEQAVSDLLSRAGLAA
jgi:hypothetical protein